jgi:hypothetical protein
MAAACGLLLTSGLVTSWQDRRFAAVQVKAVAEMFPLKELPAQFGSWRVVEGGETALDPEVSRVAGSTDSLVRTYVDQETGVALTLLVLYGRAEKVSGHTPEVCYPAIGYDEAEEAVTLPVAGGSPPALVRSTVFARKDHTLDRLEVCYAFRQGAGWSPDVEGNWKSLSADPSMFKIQIQRRVAEQERRYLDNPSVKFLEVMLPRLEERIAATGGRRTPPPAGSE